MARNNREIEIAPGLIIKKGNTPDEDCLEIHVKDEKEKRQFLLRAIERTKDPLDITANGRKSVTSLAQISLEELLGTPGGKEELVDMTLEEGLEKIPDDAGRANMLANAREAIKLGYAGRIKIVVLAGVSQDGYKLRE